jgi:hypothetical protein
MAKTRKLPAAQQQDLLNILEKRFEKNKMRHKGIDWSKVLARLITNSGKLGSLYEMENSGGEPDVVGFDKKTGEYIFYDCSIESPAGRRSLCYDREALNKRKENKPKGSIMDMADDMGIDVLSEEEYLSLQKLGNFDTKSSSWLKTPAAMRKLGGGLVGDHRFGRTFIGHNGADSYYAARGFRGSLKSLAPGNNS